MATTQKTGPCGGNGGNAKDMDVTGITRIVKLTIRHGTTIELINVRFLRNGVEETTGQWGGLNRPIGKQEEITFKPAERITSIRGYVGTFNNHFLVKSLKIQTNLGNYGPYGKEEGTPFELPALGGEIIGFHGRAGGSIDALGVYVKVANTTDGSTSGTWQEGDANFWGRPVA